MTTWVTSRTQRRIVARLDRGDSLIEAIQGEAKRQAVQHAHVSAWGTVEDAAVAMFDPERREFTAAQVQRGASAMIHFDGRIAPFEGAPRLTASVVLARGPEIIAGQLVSARAASLEVLIECWDDHGEVTTHAEPARERSREPVHAPEPPKTLADAARALESMPERFDEHEGKRDPEPGDLLDHPSFGIVDFVSEGEAGRIRIKLSTGSHREIMLEVFDVQQRESIRGKRCFLLRPRRR